MNFVVPTVRMSSYGLHLLTAVIDYLFGRVIGNLLLRWLLNPAS